MILGIGTDILAVRRMTDMHARHGGRLARRLLAPEELGDYDLARDKARFLAKRFAAKEALAKAMGTGLRSPLTLTTVGINHDALGRPDFFFTPELANWLTSRGAGAIHLSLSDEQDTVVAFVIAEKT